MTSSNNNNRRRNVGICLFNGICYIVFSHQYHGWASAFIASVGIISIFISGFGAGLPDD